MNKLFSILVFILLPGFANHALALEATLYKTFEDYNNGKADMTVHFNLIDVKKSKIDFLEGNDEVGLKTNKVSAEGYWGFTVRGLLFRIHEIDGWMGYSRVMSL